tara:strand:- start:1390 stop:1683 length:294 start_codon:yes stop_codon:yes gene_type:complete
MMPKRKVMVMGLVLLIVRMLNGIAGKVRSKTGNDIITESESENIIDNSAFLVKTIGEIMNVKKGNLKDAVEFSSMLMENLFKDKDTPFDHKDFITPN